jgi:carbonic anhydrase/acetyltransferase-like protein (isoleucine patch superfamily)
MILSHREVVPTIDPAAWIAPDATICGDVHIGANTGVMHGARVIAEGGKIRIGQYCVVMETRLCNELGEHRNDAVSGAV